MKKKKLELNKKVIASLSDVQKSKIMGGDEAAAYTTSFTNCTHFICCGDNCPTNASCNNTCGDTCADTCNCSVTCYSDCGQESCDPFTYCCA